MTHIYGIAGCGRMGLPMLHALQGAGLSARGYDICDRPGIDRDPERFARDLSVLFTVVRDADQTDTLLNTIIPHVRNLRYLVISSTVSPRYLKTLPSRVPETVALIDAPMSGAPIAAKEARLSFMLGGSEDNIMQIQPALDAMGAHFHHIGGFGAGMQAKVLNNLLAASHTLMTRLVLDWADQAGLDEAKLLALIHTSSGQNWLASNFDQIEFARHGYAPDNSIGILAKDVAAALDAAPNGAETALPGTLATLIRTLSPRK